jgi:hypothetical protein
MEMTADIIEHRGYLVLRQLLHQAEQFLTLRAHTGSVRNSTIWAGSPRARCVPVRVVDNGDSRSLMGQAHAPGDGGEDVLEVGLGLPR